LLECLQNRFNVTMAIEGK